MILLRRCILVCFCCLAIAAAARGAGRAKHVVVVVWDGMRPDFVSETTTPTLFGFMQHGVFFQNHHSAFVSSTEVNGVVLATGVHPRTSGVMANKEYWPAVDPVNPIAIEDIKSIRAGDIASHGHYLGAATVAEILRSQKPAWQTAVAGSKPVALLLDRQDRPDASSSRLLAEGVTLPASAREKIVANLGAFPAINKTKIDRDTWTARALLEGFWAKGVPPYSVLWLAEPDWSQHETGPGSSTALAAIKSSDDKLAMVLQTLADRKLLEETDVLVVSDHGFSTIERNADVALDLSLAGFTTSRVLVGAASRGTVLVVGNGGSANLYVTGHDENIINGVVAHLQQQDYTGVLFTRNGVSGTFPLSLAKLDSENAPDIVISFRWSARTNANGTPGFQISESGGKRKPGEGSHASLSRFDLHNTLIAGGPDFRKGIVDPLPSGNIDVAPTILWILGISPPTSLDGRVLTEALTFPGPKIESIEVNRHEATASVGSKVWHQYLTISEVNGTTYFDEGNGASTATLVR
jgi:predicted AlkP superfamily pyrophosphatase or phosphodiesterase